MTPERTKRVELRIRDEMGKTYFRRWTQIGPQFGASFDEACVFTDGWEALDATRRMPFSALVELVNKKKQRCDMYGKPL